MKKIVDVVGAVMTDAQGRVLCAKRSPSMSLPNLWEFPGGKIEPGENPQETLRREINEELDCIIEVHDQVEDTTYEYPAVIVRLRTFKANIVEGTPTPREHAELRWLAPTHLPTLEWAPADVPAVEALTPDYE